MQSFADHNLHEDGACFRRVSLSIGFLSTASTEHTETREWLSVPLTAMIMTNTMGLSEV